MEIRPQYTSVHYKNSSQHLDNKCENNALPCQYSMLTKMKKLNEIFFGARNIRQIFSSYLSNSNNCRHTAITIKNKYVIIVNLPNYSYKQRMHFDEGNFKNKVAIEI